MFYRINGARDCCQLRFGCDLEIAKKPSPSPLRCLLDDPAGYTNACKDTQLAYLYIAKKISLHLPESIPAL